MKIKALIASAILATAAPISASAAQLTDGLYAASDFDGNRTVWGFDIGTGVGHLWSFAADAALIVGNSGTAAQLVGTITNVASPAIEMAVNIQLTQAAGARPGFCQFNGAHDPGCDNWDPLGAVTDADIDQHLWNFFDIGTGSTISGLGSLAGLSYDITDKTNSAHPAQVGVDANALADNDKNGMSFWFNWAKTSDANSNIIYANGGSGDFNLNLADNPDPNINDVPLPAAGWLLIAAFGGLAAAKRRKA